MEIEASPLVLAYLAGVIDSDGSISIAVDRGREKRGLTAVYSELIAIGQCDPQAIELLRDTFGGSITRRGPRAEGRRGFYLWMATDKNAVRVIRALLPYLRIKRKQAELALQLRAIKDRGRAVNGALEAPRMVNGPHGVAPRRWYRTRPEVLAQYEALVGQVRLLNDTRHPFPV